MLATQYCYNTETKIHMWMAKISQEFRSDLIQMAYYPTDSCAISPSAFLLIHLAYQPRALNNHALPIMWHWCWCWCLCTPHLATGFNPFSGKWYYLALCSLLASGTKCYFSDTS